MGSTAATDEEEDEDSCSDDSQQTTNGDSSCGPCAHAARLLCRASREVIVSCGHTRTHTHTNTHVHMHLRQSTSDTIAYSQGFVAAFKTLCVTAERNMDFLLTEEPKVHNTLLA